MVRISPKPYALLFDDVTCIYYYEKWHVYNVNRQLLPITKIVLPNITTFTQLNLFLTCHVPWADHFIMYRTIDYALCNQECIQMLQVYIDKQDREIILKYYTVHILIIPNLSSNIVLLRSRYVYLIRECISTILCNNRLLWFYSSKSLGSYNMSLL